MILHVTAKRNITQQLGVDITVAVRARMQRVGSDVAHVEAINTVERSMREKFPEIRWLFFEPDLVDRSRPINDQPNRF